MAGAVSRYERLPSVSKDVLIFRYTSNQFVQCFLTKEKKLIDCSKLDEVEFTDDSTVYRTSDETVIDDTVRKSKCIDIDFRFPSHKQIIVESGRLLPKCIYNDKRPPVFETMRNRCKLLKYETGGFFTKHTDGKLDKNHFATLLAFPPRSYEGGELVLYTSSGEIVIDNSMMTNWLFVIFKLNIPHECKVITNGCRYAFKLPIKISTNCFFDVLIESDQGVMKAISDRDKNIKRMKELELQIAELNKQIEKLSNSLMTNEMELSKLKLSLFPERFKFKIYDSNGKYVNNPEVLGDSGFIILEDIYDSIMDLTGDDLALCNFLSTKYNNVSLKSGESRYTGHKEIREDDKKIHCCITILMMIL